MSTSARNSALAALVLLGGCAVGPAFHRPEAPAVTHYTTASDPAVTVEAAGTAQRLTAGAAVEAGWWHMFRSQALDAIVQEALARNPGLEAAQASLRASADELHAGYGIFFPAVSADAGASRSRFAPATFGESTPGSIFDLFSVGASVSYALDLFGGQRRLVEQLHAATDAAAATERATWLTLVANVVDAVIARAGYQAQVEAGERLVELQTEQVAIAATREQSGVDAYATLLAQRSALNQQQAALAALRQKLAQAEDLLSGLCGHVPAEWHAPPVRLEELTLPADLPVSLPSELVRQRPDILVAEATAHAASANVGVATAAMLPSITLSGTASAYSNSASRLFPANSRAWGLGATVSVPLFEGGTTWYRRREAVEQYRQAMALYRQTVETAFSQVADTLQALDHDAVIQQADDGARQNADTTLQLTRAGYTSGVSAYADLLNADVELQQARLSDIGATATRLQDSVALFAALGGGWWHGELKDGNPR